MACRMLFSLLLGSAGADPALGPDESFLLSPHAAIFGTPPVLRRGTFGAAARTDVFLFGGCEAGDSCTADLFLHSLEANTWSLVGGDASSSVKPSPRASGTATFVNGALYFFGGNAAGTLMNDVFVFHPSSVTWSRASCHAALPARRTHSRFFGVCHSVPINPWCPLSVLFPSHINLSSRSLPTRLSVVPFFLQAQPSRAPGPKHVRSMGP